MKDYREIRKTWILGPAENLKIDYFEDIKLEVFRYEIKGVPYLVTFEGRKIKPTLKYRYDDIETRDDRFYTEINKVRLNHLNKLEQKELKRMKEKEEFNKVKVGNIFASSWGYDQTNVNYYKLISIKGKTGTFVEVYKKTVKGSEGYMSSTVTPDADNHYGKEFKARITGNRIKTNYTYAYNKGQDYENIKNYCSWYA